MTTEKKKRKFQNDIGFRVGTGAIAALIIVIVAGLGFELVREAMPSIREFGFNFWRTRNWDPVSGDFGALPFIWGTLYSSILALAISTPIALGIAVFTSELSPARLRKPFVMFTELLAAVPSIVYGLWGIFVLVPMVRSFELHVSTILKELPLFKGPPVGVGMLSASLVLALMIVPYTSSVAREVLRSVPVTQREAAYALGATKFEAVRVAVSYAWSGILGAVMLGFGRALGETMAVTMLIGNAPNITMSLFSPQHTMAAAIANEFSEADSTLYLSALVEIALVLFTITLIINSLSRLMVWGIKSRGARA